MLEVGAGGGPPAAGPRAGGMPDFGQVPEQDPGIVAPGLVAMVAVFGGERADLDEQVLMPGGKPPGSVSAGRSRVIGLGEGEAGSGGTAGFSASDGPGAAVSHGVPVLVGDRDAPGGPGGAGRGLSEVAGQAGVARPGPREEHEHRQHVPLGPLTTRSRYALAAAGATTRTCAASTRRPAFPPRSPRH